MLPELENQVPLDREPAASEMIERVAAEVLETMFFTEAQVDACEHCWLATAPSAHIRFEGSHFGEMLLGVSAEAAVPIGASFLGLAEDEVTQAQRGQVVQELANILCGAMLSKLWPESKLALASPELEPWPEWPAEGALHRCFLMQEGRLAISVRLVSPSAPQVSE
jgi:hypothetical protein